MPGEQAVSRARSRDFFAALWPLVLRAPADNQAFSPTSASSSCSATSIAGNLFDTYLLWLGLVMTALILVGLLLLHRHLLVVDRTYLAAAR